MVVVRALFSGLLAAALAAPTLSAPVAGVADLPMMLTIDGQEVEDVRTGGDVRRLLAHCRPPKTCERVGLEREKRIWYRARFQSDDFVIDHRSGPPGTVWDARRRGVGRSAHFSTREMIAITADYIEGKETRFVRWKSRDLLTQ